MSFTRGLSPPRFFFFLAGSGESSAFVSSADALAPAVAVASAAMAASAASPSSRSNPKTCMLKARTNSFSSSSRCGRSGGERIRRRCHGGVGGVVGACFMRTSNGAERAFGAGATSERSSNHGGILGGGGICPLFEVTRNKGVCVGGVGGGGKTHEGGGCAGCVGTPLFERTAGGAGSAPKLGVAVGGAGAEAAPATGGGLPSNEVSAAMRMNSSNADDIAPEMERPLCSP